MTDDELGRWLAEPDETSGGDDAFVAAVMGRVAASERRRRRLLRGAALVGAGAAVLGLRSAVPVEIADIVGALVLAASCALVWIAGGGWPSLPSPARAGADAGSRR